MGWRTTSDPDQFKAATDGYLKSTAAENALLLLSVQSATRMWQPRATDPRPLTGLSSQSGLSQALGLPSGTGSPAGTGSPDRTGLLFGWWEPSDGSGPRAAFLHNPAIPLLLSGRAPELAAALAGTLAKMGRPVCGVEGPIEAADAFAAAWSQRVGTPVRVHRHCRVYRLDAASARAAAGVGGMAEDTVLGAGNWLSPQAPRPVGRLRVATAADRELLVDWITGLASEAVERIGPPQDVADDLLSYGGAVLWEIPPGDFQAGLATAGPGPVFTPVAMASLTRPVAQMVRLGMVYTPLERRRHGYGVAVTIAASDAVLTGVAPRAADAPATEVVLITDRNRPDRRVTNLGYQLVGDRAVLRFGTPTGPMPGIRTTGPMPRLPSGPMPRPGR